MLVRNFFHLSLVTLLIGISLISLNLVNASEDTTNSAIEAAESAVISAFEAVTVAEKAGGNVSINNTTFSVNSSSLWIRRIMDFIIRCFLNFGYTT